MKGVMPQEIEVWYILPALRRESSKIMLEKGLNQREISKHLFLTEAAVSQYMNGKRGKEIEFTDEIRNDIKESVERILKHGNLIAEFQVLCKKIRSSGLLCETHKKHGIVTKECEDQIICLEEP